MVCEIYVAVFRTARIYDFDIVYCVTWTDMVLPFAGGLPCGPINLHYFPGVRALVDRDLVVSNSEYFCAPVNTPNLKERVDLRPRVVDFELLSG